MSQVAIIKATYGEVLYAQKFNDDVTPINRLRGHAVIQALKDNVSLAYADLVDVDLSNLALDNRSFHNVEFHNANLSSINFSDSNFSFCIFDYANLSGSLLRNVYIDNSRFYKTLMARADINGANVFHGGGIIDAGIDNRGYRFIGINYGEEWMVKAGCRWFSIENAKHHWEVGPNHDALARVGVIEAGMKKINLL